MQFFQANTDDFSRIEKFLLPWEFSCVTLSSYVRKHDEHIYIFAENQNSEGIFGLIYFDRVLLHCFPAFLNEDFSKQKDFEQALQAFVQKEIIESQKKLTCLNGAEPVTKLILDLFEKLDINPSQINHYKLMTLEEIPLEPPESISLDDEIKRCGNSEQDIELLLELQKMYMAKEVAPVNHKVSDAEAAAQLKSILKNQLCFALYSDGELVSKANTNAIGCNWVQLGGVYTHPLYRKNYYAWHLVYTLCTRIQKTGRRICLFVKEKNNPAVSLYTRIGFNYKSNYSIVYFY